MNRRATSVLLAAVCAMVPFGCAQRGKPEPERTPRSTLADGAGVAGAPALEVAVLPLGALFPQPRVIDASVATRSLASFRRERSPTRVQIALDGALHGLLSQAADALNQGQPAAAVEAAAEAVRLAPERLEPLEVLLLAQLAVGEPGEVRATLAKLSAIEPSNPIALAFEGLDASQRGDPAAALANFAWFIGDGAVERRGAAIPLPTASGEIEEQAVFAALRLGAAQAALEAIEAGRMVRSGDPVADRRLMLLRAHALSMLGRFDEAREAFGVLATGRDVFALLALARCDELDVARGMTMQAAAAAYAAFERDPSDDFALRRLVRFGGVPSDRAERVPLGAGASGIEDDGGRYALRRAVVAAIASREGSAIEARRALEATLVADPTDRAAARAALAVVARHGIAAAVSAAARAVEAHPNELDAVATALAASGFEVDALLLELRRSEPGAGASALRSRLLARFAAPEEAFAVAEAARSRDRASWPALAASALAAAELGDDTLLEELDDDALAAGDVVARTLAAGWLALGEMPRAADRASRARRHDPSDDRARLIEALATIGDPARRGEALDAIRAVAGGGGRASLDALIRLEGLEPLATSDAAGAAPGGLEQLASSDPVLVLTRAMPILESSRMGLGAACLALAEDLDPSILGSSGANTEGSAAARAVAGNVGTTTWLAASLADAPSIAARRQLAWRELDRVRAGSGGDAGAVPETERMARLLSAAGPVAARFDALCKTDEAGRARAALAQSALRPRTASALAAVARAAAVAGDAAAAVAALEAATRASPEASASGVVSPRAARALLGAAAELARRDPASSQRLVPVVEGLLARLVRTGPDDMLLAMRVLIAAGADEEALDRSAALLAHTARPIELAELRAYGSMLEQVVAIDRDPFPASRLARALVGEPRLAVPVRARLAASTVALDAAAGADPSDTIAFVEALVAEGVPVFARGDEPPPSIGQALVRAAGVASMVGDESMSDELLLAALRNAPGEAEAMNNLAYRAIERGDLTPEAISFAERAAAAAPDNPSILDTLGLLRYKQGRLDDDAGGVGAITLFRQALRLEPENPSLTTLDHLGDALWRSGDQEGAVRCWRQIPDLAILRYPPAEMARGLADFQRREFGLELVEPASFLRRQYGNVVQRADRKVQEVGRGLAPSLAPVAGGG